MLEYNVGNNFHGSLGDKAQQICRYWDLGVSAAFVERERRQCCLSSILKDVTMQGCFDLKEFAKFHF